jgi:UDP-N-acetylglucosamine acyltransferase
MSDIHDTAIIDKGAKIGSDVEIGPFCVIGSGVTLHDNVTLHSHVSIAGNTQIGAHSTVFPFASLGHAPQDKKYNGEASRLEIGAHNIIREHVTMNPGTQGGGLLTKTGEHCLFMTASHVAHDCMVGNHVILANNATLAGHVSVGDGTIIGGLSAIHQFVRIGKGAFIGGMSGVEKDVIPYGTVKGERASLDGLNLVGLKRSTIERDEIHKIRHVFKELFYGQTGTLSTRAQQLKETYESDEVHHLIDFILEDSSRSFCTPIASKVALKNNAA